MAFLVSMKYLKNEHDAQEMVLQVFEKLLTDLGKHEISNFKSWLYSVTKNECLMWLRKRKTIALHNGKYAVEQEYFMESEEPVHLMGEDKQKSKVELLKKGLNELKNEQRKCVEMFYLHEKSYVEVAAETGYELKKVKSYIQNGKRNLMSYLTKHGVSSSLVLLLKVLLINNG